MMVNTVFSDACKDIYTGVVGTPLPPNSIPTQLSECLFFPDLSTMGNVFSCDQSVTDDEIATITDKMPTNPFDKINPGVPVDLVIDHSVMVNAARGTDSLEKNEKLEFERNK